ncbi:MAG: hypothetical protein K2L21_09225 [Muribaculaceae bacterium]|nr:hypothetical protein [Muribaculaceae bacterium]
MAEKFYPISPYVFCNGNPIANVDKDGNLTIFVNGFHFGDGDSSAYWNGVDKQIMDYLKDQRAVYLDGSNGGLRRTTTPNNQERNIRATKRIDWGKKAGQSDAKIISAIVADDEKNHVVTHSMGAAYAKGYIRGLKKVLGDDFIKKIEWEIDIAPYQPEKQSAAKGVSTGLLQHDNDGIAKHLDMEGMAYKESSRYRGESSAHSIDSFSNELISFIINFIAALSNKSK